MKKRNAMAAVLVTAGLVLGGGGAWAGTTLSSYSTTVTSFGGDGYTTYQTKSGSKTDGRVESTNVGGDYKVSVRMKSSSGTGATWTGYVVDDGTVHKLRNSFSSGTSVRANLHNQPLTKVSVQVDGKWKSN